MQRLRLTDSSSFRLQERGEPSAERINQLLVSIQDVSWRPLSPGNGFIDVVTAITTDSPEGKVVW